MVSKYSENGRDISTGFVHEKETFCDQYEPIRVFRAGFEFLNRRCFENMG